jgi:TetR/AcrR family tetracycline transcriptional repressor
LVTTEPGAAEAHDPTAREDSLRVKRATLGALPPRRYPRIVASADALICPTDPERYFDLGIDLALAGIRGVLADLQSRTTVG